MGKLPLVIVVVLIVCAIQWEAEAKPVKKSYMGLEGLDQPMWTDGNRKAEHHFERYDPITFRRIQLHYTTELAENVIRLDDVKDLEEIISPKENHLLLTFSSSSSRDAFQSSLHQGDLLAGGVHWGCQMTKGVRSIMAKVIDFASTKRGSTSLAIQTVPAQHSEFFKNTHIEFTNSLFRPISPPRNEPEHLLTQRSRSKRGIIDGFPFGIVKKAINDVENFANQVANVVETAAKDVENLVNGDFNASDSYDFTIFNYNYNATTQYAINPLTVGPVVCENCYAYLDLELQFLLTVQDFTVEVFNVTFTGNATGMLEGVTINLLQENQNFNQNLDTIQFDPITLDIFGVPLILSPSLPIAMNGNLQASGNVSVAAGAEISVQTTVGFYYSPGDGTKPIESSSFIAQGYLNNITFQAQAEATLGITFTPTVSIDYFFVVSAGFNPYLALTADGQISSSVTNLPAGSMSWNLGYGLQISVGGSIPLLGANWTPLTYQSGIVPITNGLLTFDNSTSSPQQWYPWNLTSADMVTVGNSYYGYQAPTGSGCGLPWGNITLQITSQNGTSEYEAMVMIYGQFFQQQYEGYVWEIVTCLMQSPYMLSINGLEFEATPVGSDYYWECTSSSSVVSPAAISGNFTDSTYQALTGTFESCGFVSLQTASSG